jgi:hypothetical protein
MMEGDEEFFNNLSLDSLLPIDDSLPLSIIDYTITPTSEMVELLSINSTVSQIVLSS